MDATTVHNTRKDAKLNRRRRKKRRTEDFSSDSSSSSDSNSEKEPEQDIESAKAPTLFNINDIDIHLDAEKTDEHGFSGLAPDPLAPETMKHLLRIQLTHTTLANSTSIIRPHNIAHAEEVQEKLAAGKSQLDSEYLAFMATEFSSDLDELRKKPDFTDKSLVVLAKSLQAGSSLFDRLVLRSMLES